MLFMKLSSMVDGDCDLITDKAAAEADYKTGRRVGQYRVSDRAIYQADGKFLPFSAVTDVFHDKAAVHVSGCCAGGVLVDRLVMSTEKEKFKFLFDTKREIQKMSEILEKNGLTIVHSTEHQI